DQRVGEERRGVHDATDLRGLGAGLGQRLARALDRADRRVVRRRALLPDHGAAALRIVDDEVGEGTPDVDAEGERCGHYRYPKDSVVSTGATRSGETLPASSKVSPIRASRSGRDDGELIRL